VLSLLIFSHGLGGTCEGYEYLGTHWSKKGYIKIFQALIKKSSTEFWDAYLKNKPESKIWLSTGDFEKEMVGKAVVEKKINQTSGKIFQGGDK
jgi:hypothetical protein